MADEKDIRIKVEDLTLIFGKKKKEALKLLNQGYSKTEILKKTKCTIGVNKASFEIKKGEIFVIMGLSGSGKSTLIRCLNRLNDPTDGRVFFKDHDITRDTNKELLETRRTEMSMVFQKFGLLPHRTILENAAFGLEIRGEEKQAQKEKAQRALDTGGLKGYEQQYPNELSGGMQQRVGLARALANDPEILLMDEAFSALDPLIRTDMQDELLELQSEMSKTIVFITHDLDEALKLGDRIAIMKEGKVVQIGTPETILTEPSDDYVRAFVQNVDRTKIITAKSIMRKAPTVDLKKDGPGVASRKMEKAGVSTVYVLGEQRKFKGVVTIDDANRLKNENVKSLDDIIRNDAYKTLPDTPIKQLLSEAIGSTVPIAVIDSNDKFLGVVDRASIINEVKLNSSENGAVSNQQESENIEEINT